MGQRSNSDAEGVSLDEIYFFTDSCITLTWVRSPGHDISNYVQRKIAKVRQATELWHSVPMALNLANLLSRGTTLKALHQSMLW